MLDVSDSLLKTIFSARLFWFELSKIPGYTGLSKILVGKFLSLKIVLCKKTETFVTNSVHHKPRYNPGHHANTWSLNTWTRNIQLNQRNTF